MAVRKPSVKPDCRNPVSRVPARLRWLKFWIGNSSPSSATSHSGTAQSRMSGEFHFLIQNFQRYLTWNRGEHERVFGAVRGRKDPFALRSSREEVSLHVVRREQEVFAQRRNALGLLKFQAPVIRFGRG